jgi:hypothetical protein
MCWPVFVFSRDATISRPLLSNPERFTRKLKTNPGAAIKRLQRRRVRAAERGLDRRLSTLTQVTTTNSGFLRLI